MVVEAKVTNMISQSVQSKKERGEEGQRDSSKRSMNALPPSHAIFKKVSISPSDFANVPYSL